MLTLLIAGLFGFMFIGMTLMVFLGARTIEDELREREGEARGIRAHTARIPRFLVVGRPAASWAAQPDEALLGQVQQYLESEQLLADEFVLQPSIESLYRESGRRLGH